MKNFKISLRDYEYSFAYTFMHYIIAVTLLLISYLMGGCVSGPKITICVVDTANNGYQCTKPDKSHYFLEFRDSDNYIAISPDDAEALFNYIKSKQKE